VTFGCAVQKKLSVLYIGLWNVVCAVLYISYVVLQENHELRVRGTTVQGMICVSGNGSNRRFVIFI
jgi:hypothetical protein